MKRVWSIAQRCGLLAAATALLACSSSNNNSTGSSTATRAAAPASVAASAAAPATAAGTARPGTPAAAATTTAGGTAAAGPAKKLPNFAMILPGTVQDADFNAVGFEALKAIEKKFGVKTAYSENVGVPDAERVAREYIDQGYGIIALHGGQFPATAVSLGKQFPKVQFIVESLGQQDNLPDNVWDLGRPIYQAYYPIGALAALTSKSGKIAFLAGITLPDYKAGANAWFAGAKAARPDINLQYTFTGDSNDGVKGRQAAVALLSSGVDVITSGLNDANFGLVEAVKDAGKPVSLTGNYTDKRTLSPAFIASIVFDFSDGYGQILTQIGEGKRTGYYEMTMGKGLSVQTYTIDAAAKAKVDAIVADIQSGKTTVTPKTDEVVLP